jgi:hypothetical protein
MLEIMSKISRRLGIDNTFPSVQGYFRRFSVVTKELP